MPPATAPRSPLQLMMPWAGACTGIQEMEVWRTHPAQGHSVSTPFRVRTLARPAWLWDLSPHPDCHGVVNPDFERFFEVYKEPGMWTKYTGMHAMSQPSLEGSSANPREAQQLSKPGSNLFPREYPQTPFLTLQSPWSLPSLPSGLCGSAWCYKLPDHASPSHSHPPGSSKGQDIVMKIRARTQRPFQKQV